MSLLDKQEVQYICEHTALHARKWSGFICKRASEDMTLSGLVYSRKKKKKEECQIAIFFTSPCLHKLRYYSGVIP